MKKLLILALFLVQSFILLSQCPTLHHWEAAVLDNQSWKYTVPSTSIANWNQLSFNDATWTTGTGGIGYGDGDDATVIPTSSNMVYMRRSFNIIDTAAIDWVVLCMDYDDGFIAYLNGSEIARSNIANNASWNTMAYRSHEARLYQNEQPAYYFLTASQVNSLLHNGTNVLAVESRNTSVGMDDLSSRPFLLFGIKNSTYNYQPTPSWFHAPISFSTKLPLMMIQTDGQSIMDDPRINCHMGIIYHGPGNQNCVADNFNHYFGDISIELRGSTSQSFPKTPYGFSTLDENGASKNVSLLGMPEENDWVLLNPYTDKTFMRDLMSYDLGRALGWYASRAQFLELFVDGDYKGVYVLLEKIKRDDERVDIAKLDNTMNSGDALTGGYIYKIDKTTGNSGGVWYSSNYGVSLQNHVPSWDEITTAQQNYLQYYINSFENSLVSSAYANPQTGYRKYANIFSFADLFILNEVSNNVDGYRLSTYIHKDRDSRCGRFTMGPIWDYNLSFGNANYCNGQPTSGWQMYQGCGDGSSKWIDRMLQDPWFKDVLGCRYAALRQTILSTNALTSRVDSYRNYLLEAHVRDSTVWQTIGNWIWPNAWVASTWQGEIDNMKDWIVNRMQWLDANMYSGTSPCNSASTFNVVIDEINYHSDSTLNAGDWIELYNAGSTTADLSHAIIMDVNNRNKYCVLPAGTSLVAGGRLVIYADSLLFQTAFPTVTNKIGPLCFKLSDSSQNITLLDKNNRASFSVTYNDDWQCVTDGYGRTLQLLSPTSIPNVSTSWIASCMKGSPGTAYVPCNENPIYSEVNYNSSSSQDAGDWFEIHNKTNSGISLGGWKLKNENNSQVYTFPSGYMLFGQSHLVIYSDAIKFNSQFPTVFNKLGPTGFGLSSGSDVIRLYDASNILRYSFCYSSQSPWPQTPNGQGYTLENGQYNGNINSAASWFAGCPEGSPGMAYNANCFPLETTFTSINNSVSVYPNPSSSVLFIGGIDQPDQIELYDVQGRKQLLVSTQNSIDIKHLANGIYTLKLLKNNVWYSARFVKE